MKEGNRKFATSMDFREASWNRIQIFDLCWTWKFEKCLKDRVFTMEKKVMKKTAKQTQLQQILLRCLLGIAALRSRTGVSCVCCTINELRPRSGPWV